MGSIPGNYRRHQRKPQCMETKTEYIHVVKGGYPTHYI